MLRNAVSHQSVPPPVPAIYQARKSVCEVEMPATTICAPINPRHIYNVGSIARVQVPRGWQLTDATVLRATDKKCIQVSPTGNPAVTLKISLRLVPLSDEGASSFQRLIERKSAKSRSELLLPSEIRRMTELLMHLGNNQFVFPNRPYAFKLTHAATVMINGRTLLEIRGAFVDAVSEYRAYFWQCDEHRNVQQIILEGRPGHIDSVSTIFKNFLQSIEWR